MSDEQQLRDQISDFETKYDYDAAYMHDLLERSPDAFQAFSAARQMTSFFDRLPAEAHYVAAISVMQLEDCGSCLELNIKLAREAGVGRTLLQTLLDSPDSLPAELQDIRQHARAVSQGETVDPQCADRIRQHYGEDAFGELAICVAGVRIYPALKRALLKSGTCSIAPVVV